MKIPFWATLLTIFSIIILCGLGYWQVQRLAWKQGIMDKLANAYESGSAKVIDFQALDADEFVYGSAFGVFRADKALMLEPRVLDDVVGAHLIVPLETSQGTLLINMGWSDLTKGDLPIMQENKKDFRVEGLARSVSWNDFTPENQPENDSWYKLDIDEIARVKQLDNPINFVLFAEKSSEDFDGMFPNNQRWQPNNNHKQYAFFWFAMAGVLFVIYVLRFLVPLRARHNFSE